MTQEERAYNYASTQKPTKLQVGEIAKHYNNGYNQAMKDFLEWLKDCSTFTYSNGYKRIDDDLYSKLVEDFKNYINKQQC